MKKLVLMLALSLSLFSYASAQDKLPKIEVTGVVYVEDKASLSKKTPKSACILNDRIYYRDQYIEVNNGKLLGAVQPGKEKRKELKKESSLLFISDIYRGTVEVVYQGEKYKLKLKKRTSWGLTKEKKDASSKS